MSHGDGSPPLNRIAWEDSSGRIWCQPAAPLQSKGEALLRSQGYSHIISVFPRFLEKMVVSQQRAQTPSGPVGVWSLPPAKGMSIWGRSSESAEGQGLGGVCSPAQLASGISSDWLGLLCSVTCGRGSLGRSLPWASTLLKIPLVPSYSQQLLLCHHMFGKRIVFILDLHYSSPANQ